MNTKKLIFLLFCIVLIHPILDASSDTLIKLEGNYLVYSYDFNQIFGEQVKFKFNDYDVSCYGIKVDIPSRSFYAYGGVTLEKLGEAIVGDEFIFDPKQNNGTLVILKDEIMTKQIGGKEGEENSLERNPSLEEISLSKIKRSFIHFSGEVFEITKDFEVYGYNITLYIEGLESVGLKKFNMSEGVKKSFGGFNINKIWFTKSQGIIARASYFYEKKDKVNSLTQINYEERSVLKDYFGPKRQVDIMTSTTTQIDENSNFGFTANYNSSRLWNTNFWWNRNWGQNVRMNIDLSYNKPVNYQGELWVGMQTAFDSEKLGNLLISGKLGEKNQMLGNISYSKTFLKNINILLTSSYSKTSIAGSNEFSEIATGGVSLSYNSKIFNLSTDYFLNSDLFSSQTLSQPQLRFGINPFNFYGGLLTAHITNIFIHNRLKRKDIQEDMYSNNTIFSLTTQPIYLQKSFFLDFGVSLEQFIEKEGRNFTSGGFIINADKELFSGTNLEFYYSVQSRRKTEGWLIEGTTSQDLSAILRVNPSDRINGWASISYDPKNKEWRQSFLEVSIGIIKKWKFHSLLNYDFLLGKLNNIDLYLIREAGRFQLRFAWRSLSKQFLVDLIPR